MAVLLGLSAALGLAAQAAPRVPTPAEIELEVLENVKRQPLGDGAVDDLALPEEFLRRVADRIVRSSYEERYRIVVKGPGSPALGVEEMARRWRGPAALVASAIAVLGIVWIALARRRSSADR